MFDELSRISLSLALSLFFVYGLFVSLARNDCFQQWLFVSSFHIIFRVSVFVYKMIDSAVYFFVSRVVNFTSFLPV